MLENSHSGMLAEKDNYANRIRRNKCAKFCLEPDCGTTTGVKGPNGWILYGMLSGMACGKPMTVVQLHF